ncbi:aminotransferase class V-fold PLP-dependent enzyme [Pseudonocardia sp. MH-G8]|uniref:aminotransferase class V-fold PLP-dependent enzyme n=1 Tax=Pseudonocardia sp. MH-G8 TaxID=1854588 RepID=UPI000BA08215|nr:aminotransferase class V-fold PLP-dependent enzyme [Pseudonocardia sp. MH-G8]OZM80211.1 cysteine desulfurase [Pseudonocardia sp. MH-G8]
MTAVLPTRPAVCAPALPRVVGADLQVPLVTGERVRYANLDLAASAPALEPVADHVTALLPYYASVHRGAGYASQVSTTVLERARETVGRFVGARADDVVVFTRNTTDALNLLAGCVPGPVLRLDAEHHANLLAWGPGRVLRTGGTVAQTLADLRDALAADRPALLAVTGASNVTGELLPLAEVTALAHAAGARVVVDAAQLAPHRRIDIAAAGVDYLALSGHKLYAPYGAGALVGRRDWLDVASPHLAGGGAVRAVSAPDADGVTEVSWAPAPHRHEAGTPNVLGAAALAEACRHLESGLDPAHEAALLHRLETGLAAIPGVRTLRIWPDSTDRVAVTTFVVEGRPAGLVAAYLSAEHGIGVRDGKFCAHPLLQRLAGTDDGCAVRASFGLGTTAADVDRLVDALEWLVTDGPAWTYAVVDGRWSPTPDPRDLDPLGVGPTSTAPLPACGH